jgi:dUTPase
VFGAQVVDYLYQGEIHLSVINVSSSVVRIYEDMKLLQFLETPVFNSDIAVENGCSGHSCKDVVTSEDFYEGMSTERGADGFGSSDNKTIKNKK